MGCLDHEKLLALEKILVKDNEKVVGVSILKGYMGVGGSNRSGFQTESCYDYTVEQLDGAEPIRVMKAEICALANDVLYLRWDVNGKRWIHAIDCDEGRCTLTGESIAYDTVVAARVVLNLKQD